MGSVEVEMLTNLVETTFGREDRNVSIVSASTSTAHSSNFFLLWFGVFPLWGVFPLSSSNEFDLICDLEAMWGRVMGFIHEEALCPRQEERVS